MPIDLAPAPDAPALFHQLASDDPAFAQSLLTMAWDAYEQAGRPLGPDEEAMWAWWTYGQGTTVQ